MRAGYGGAEIPEPGKGAGVFKRSSAVANASGTAAQWASDGAFGEVLNHAKEVSNHFRGGGSRGAWRGSGGYISDARAAQSGDAVALSRCARRAGARGVSDAQMDSRCRRQGWSTAQIG